MIVRPTRTSGLSKAAWRHAVIRPISASSDLPHRKWRHTRGRRATLQSLPRHPTPGYCCAIFVVIKKLIFSLISLNLKALTLDNLQFGWNSNFAFTRTFKEIKHTNTKKRTASVILFIDPLDQPLTQSLDTPILLTTLTANLTIKWLRRLRWMCKVILLSRRLCGQCRIIPLLDNGISVWATCP